MADSMPKASRMCLAVLTQHRCVTDIQTTDTQAHNYCRAGKNSIKAQVLFVKAAIGDWVVLNFLILTHEEKAHPRAA